jgi:hypothetical protein
MKTLVMEAKQCPKCGRVLPGGALAGLCPACLLAQGAETDAGEGRAAPFHPPPLAEVAKLFPQLEIISLLGAGGMGAVYKARQPGLDRFVALKVLPAANTSGVNFAERFNREARALARLSHPNIVAVHEFGQAGALHYFIMEFVDGANLRQLEQASRLSPREALQIIPQICDALQYAHDEGVVHRDIKPENVLIDRRGRVKIADFGLAKILGRDGETARLTLEGQVMGTPHYMAPEQVERPLAVDHRADIYSLGVVFYEMLTGDLPLGKFSPPSRKVQVDVRFDEVVLRALENDPARRYQKASEVKSHVETIAGTPTPATPHQGERFLGWAGFAVVAERGGRRTVHWKGALIALAVTFGILTIAFGFVSAITGRSLLGWIGVVGWQSVVMRLIIAVLAAGWGVWRALRSEREPEVLPPAKVILPSSARRWVIGRRVVFASILVLAWCQFQFTSLTPWLRARFADDHSPSGIKVSQVAVRDAKTGTFVARLPKQGTIELLAVGETNSGPGAWWGADGAVLPNADYEVRNPVENSAASYVSKDVLLRIRNLPNGASMTGMHTEPHGSIASGAPAFRGGKPLSGAIQARIASKPSARKADIQVGFGLDGWRTIGLIAADGRSQDHMRQPGDPYWRVNFHHEPIDTADGAQMAVVFGPDSRMWQHQFVVADTNGVEHAASNSQGTPIGGITGQGKPLEGLTLWTFKFHGLRLAQLKEFRVQVRPVHWVEFPDVALAPRSTLPRIVPPSFGPVVERSFTGVIDFDTGVTTNFTLGALRGYPAAVSNMDTRMQQNGFDAAAGVSDELQTLDMDFVLLENADWDTLSAAELTKRVYRNYYHPAKVKPQNGSTTFGFRTREHGVGILRLVAYSGRGMPGTTLRYKLVQRARRQTGPFADTAERAAKATFAGAGPELVEPAQLRFLAWQDEWKTSAPNGAWHPDGSPATNAAEIELLRKLWPSVMDVSATEAGKRDPCFLHMWFSHPLINQNGLNEITLFDTNGAAIELAGGGSTTGRTIAAPDQADNMGWFMSTLSPGEGKKIPPRLTVRFRYAVGPLEREREIASDYQGSMSLEGNSHLNGIGQDIEEKAFVAIAVEAHKTVSRHFGVIAVTRDGRELAATGNSTSGHTGSALRVANFSFNVPLKEIAHFRVGTRPILTTEWKDVALLQNGK